MTFVEDAVHILMDERNVSFQEKQLELIEKEYTFEKLKMDLRKRKRELQERNQNIKNAYLILADMNSPNPSVVPYMALRMADLQKEELEGIKEEEIFTYELFLLSCVNRMNALGPDYTIMKNFVSGEMDFGDLTCVDILDQVTKVLNTQQNIVLELQKNIDQMDAELLALKYSVKKAKLVVDLGSMTVKKLRSCVGRDATFKRKRICEESSSESDSEYVSESE